jgi:hypothetical protein
MNKIVKSLMLLAALLSFGGVNARSIYVFGKQNDMKSNDGIVRKNLQCKACKIRNGLPYLFANQ